MNRQPPDYTGRLRSLAKVRDQFFEQFDRLNEGISDDLEALRRFDFRARPGETAAQAFQRIAHPLLLAVCDGDSPSVLKLVQAMRDSRLDFLALLCQIFDELPKGDRDRLKGRRPTGAAVAERQQMLRKRGIA